MTPFVCSMNLFSCIHLTTCVEIKSIITKLWDFITSSFSLPKTVNIMVIRYLSSSIKNLLLKGCPYFGLNSNWLVNLNRIALLSFGFESGCQVPILPRKHIIMGINVKPNHFILLTSVLVQTLTSSLVKMMPIQLSSLATL